MLREALDRYYYIMTINEHKRLGSRVICSNITYNSILYLDLIAYTPDCTPSKLAEILNVSKAAVASKSAELIRHGLIESVKSKTDKRVRYLKLTPKASELYEISDKAFEKTVEDLNLLYTADEIAGFCEILNKFTELYTGELENGFN